jgi:hypothetical protein
MGKDPNELLSEQQRRQHEGRKPGHGTLETVGLEQKSVSSEIEKLQPYVVNALAVIGAGALIYLVLDLIF